jgi:hypothetical protein
MNLPRKFSFFNPNKSFKVVRAERAAVLELNRGPLTGSYSELIKGVVGVQSLVGVIRGEF